MEHIYITQKRYLTPIFVQYAIDKRICIEWYVTKYTGGFIKSNMAHPSLSYIKHKPYYENGLAVPRSTDEMGVGVDAWHR